MRVERPPGPGSGGGVTARYHNPALAPASIGQRAARITLRWESTGPSHSKEQECGDSISQASDSHDCFSLDADDAGRMATEVGEVAVAAVDTPASTNTEIPPPSLASTEAQEGSAAVVDMPTSTEMKEVPAPVTPEAVAVAVEVAAVAVEVPEVVAVTPASPPPGPPEAPPASTKGKPPLLAPFTTAASEAISVKKVVVIYNPVSGGKRGQKLMDNVVSPAFKEAGVEVVVLATQHSGHGVGLAETADLNGVDALCALGGDGTLSEIINGFMRREPQPSCAIGFLPGGTGNTFMHDVMGKKQRGEAAVRAAVAVIVGGLTRKVDLSRLECFGPDGTTPLTRYSINIVTAGFGVVINAKAETRRWMGPARYSFTHHLIALMT